MWGGVFVMLFFPFVGHAQERSYHYANIVVDVEVRADTTVRIAETQTYQFVGTYHQGWRSIPHTKIDSVDEITVTDKETGKALQYSRSRLDKEDSKSWGKYTVFNQDGATNIEWYYDLRNTPDPTQHTWTISYTVHGALAFYDTHDELYWNVSTDYDVPIDTVTAVVHLPGAVTQPSAAFYTTNNLAYAATRPDDRTFFFATQNVAPREDVTFAVGWQKGLVDQSAYWVDAAKVYWGQVLAVGIFFAASIFSVLYWRRQKYLNRGSGTIVAEYEPPENLPAAMADVLVDGSASTKVWPATMVDLAIRGFVRIKEDTSKEPFWRKRSVHFFVFVFLIGVFTTGVYGAVTDFSFNTFALIWIPFVWFCIIVILVLKLGLFAGLQFRKKDYIVERISGKDVSQLESYEQKFLSTVFAFGGVFSTKEFARDKSKAQALYMQLEMVKQGLIKEVVADTQAFAVAPGSFPALMLVFGVFGGALLFFVPTIASGAVLWLLMSLVLSCGVVFLTMYTPRHNTKGALLTEKWLGFKLYLETAERYRMQNLTPEIFEKYLPYAMIFGVEKKWAKNFEAMHLPPPQWYSGAAYVGSGNAASAFSPSTFATGFSASFASSFSSAGGGGASGGGGGAGGGGGGGGGGAS
jgi:uncharacterized membrane protein YgcG